MTMEHQGKHLLSLCELTKLIPFHILVDCDCDSCRHPTLVGKWTGFSDSISPLTRASVRPLGGLAGQFTDQSVHQRPIFYSHFLTCFPGRSTNFLETQHDARAETWRAGESEREKNRWRISNPYHACILFKQNALVPLEHASQSRTLLLTFE